MSLMDIIDESSFKNEVRITRGHSPTEVGAFALWAADSYIPAPDSETADEAAERIAKEQAAAEAAGVVYDKDNEGKIRLVVIPPELLGIDP